MVTLDALGAQDDFLLHPFHVCKGNGCGKSHCLRETGSIH